MKLDGKVILTAEGLRKLQDELTHLREVERPAVLVRIKEAKDMGDLSENADYQDARDQQAFIEGRILELEEKLKNAEVAAPTSGGGEVQIGSAVTVRGSSGERKLQIVGANEASPSDGLISHESPLGGALLGRRVGDKVNVKTPAGEISYEVVSIG